MKKLLYLLTIFSFISCGEEIKTTDNQHIITKLQAYKEHESEAERTKQFIEEYIDAVNSPDWKSKTVEYLPNPDADK